MRVAIIDLGTNSVRLFIYDIDTEGFHKRVFQAKHMVRLGDSLFDKHKLNWKAYRRTIAAFVEFREQLKDFKPDEVHAVATSAMRETSDRKRLTKIIKRHSGISLEVISGQREAELIATGVTATLKLPKGKVLLIDIGGGSTELSYCNDGVTKYSVSLDIGAARCQQVFLKTVPPNQDRSTERKLRAQVKKLLRKHPKKFAKNGYVYAIGTSGSIRAMNRIANGEGDSGKAFSAKFLTQLRQRLFRMTREEIAKIKTLEDRRIDLILSAVIILEEIVRHFEIKEVLATNCALKDGLLIQVGTLKTALSVES